MSKGEEYDRIKVSALRYLANREHSQFELRVKLSKKFDSIESIQSVIAECAGSGYQSDQRFMESFIRNKISRGYGPNIIIYELNQHGIPSECVDSYFSLENISWVDIIERVYKKKFLERDWKDKKRKLKIYRYFNQKGFDSNLIRRSLNVLYD